MTSLFRKSSRNPIIGRRPNTFHSVHVANPDVVYFRGRHLMIFRGQDERSHDEIGVATNRLESFQAYEWELPDVASIRVTSNSKKFDSGHILDPATFVRNDLLFVYYTAHRSDWDSWNIPSHIGLAVSDDGATFKKHGKPIIEGMAPEVVSLDGKVYLIFQRLTEAGTFAFYLSESRDGLDFDRDGIRRIMKPSGIPGQFDQHSISTARIWREGDWFLMAYGGCMKYTDYPEAIGLARSRDLIHWERYPNNPVLRRGRAGAWDEGALWFATGFIDGDTTYLFYEGVGRAPEARGRRDLARLCRAQDYGGYATVAFSQVGVATARGPLAAW